MAFSITETQYQTLLARVTALEQQANDQAVALDKFVTLSQINQLDTLNQQLIESLNQQVQAFEARLTAIEEEPLT